MIVSKPFENKYFLTNLLDSLEGKAYSFSDEFMHRSV